MSFVDRSKVKEYTAMAVGEPNHELPSVMVCPGNHGVRQLMLTVEASTQKISVPCYPCLECQIVYRYQECTQPLVGYPES